MRAEYNIIPEKMYLCKNNKICKVVNGNIIYFFEVFEFFSKCSWSFNYNYIDCIDLLFFFLGVIIAFICLCIFWISLLSLSFRFSFNFVQNIPSIHVIICLAIVSLYMSRRSHELHMERATLVSRTSLSWGNNRWTLNKWDDSYRAP